MHGVVSERRDRHLRCTGDRLTVRNRVERGAAAEKRARDRDSATEELEAAMTRVEPVQNQASNRLFQEDRSGLAEDERQRAQAGWQPWQRSEQGWRRQQED